MTKKGGKILISINFRILGLNKPHLNQRINDGDGSKAAHCDIYHCKPPMDDWHRRQPSVSGCLSREGRRPRCQARCSLAVFERSGVGLSREDYVQLAFGTRRLRSPVARRADGYRIGVQYKLLSGKGEFLWPLWLSFANKGLILFELIVFSRETEHSTGWRYHGGCSWWWGGHCGAWGAGASYVVPSWAQMEEQVPESNWCCAHQLLGVC